MTEEMGMLPPPDLSFRMSKEDSTKQKGGGGGGSGGGKGGKNKGKKKRASKLGLKVLSSILDLSHSFSINHRYQASPQRLQLPISSPISLPSIQL